ncbi:AAA family ATPase [Kitasatospora sp. NPDC048194]|uniref:AAA family ATPase n=1 Tax=Kitasatospora sp. NPDC048194 TaxID=3364045 RepID=UPI003715C6E3
MAYPADAVVVVSGLPGAGKSTLLRRWSGGRAGDGCGAPVVDPRAVHEACEALMPAWLPYGVYRPWARWEHFRLLRRSVRRGGPLLVHDCGSRAWMRRWLAWEAGRRGRELHLVLLDVGAMTALEGQRARGRHASVRVFARHRRGLERLSRAFTGHVRSNGPTLPPPVAPAPTPALPAVRTRAAAPVPHPTPEAVSVLLLDGVSRSRAVGVRFG